MNQRSLSRQQLTTKKALNQIYTLESHPQRRKGKGLKHQSSVITSLSRKSKKESAPKNLVPNFRGCGPGGSFGTMQAKLESTTTPSVLVESDREAVTEQPRLSATKDGSFLNEKPIRDTRAHANTYIEQRQQQILPNALDRI